jgi:hypothetical protein
MKRYIVTLTAEERQSLLDLIAAGKALGNNNFPVPAYPISYSYLS